MDSEGWRRVDSKVRLRFLILQGLASTTIIFRVLHTFEDVVWHVSWSVSGNILAVSGGDNKVGMIWARDLLLLR